MFDKPATSAQVDGHSLLDVQTFRAALQPLKARADRGDIATSLVDQLRVIGARLAPTLSTDQAKAWTLAVIATLSDLPPDVIGYGLERAVHRPMRFLSDVDGEIRRLADPTVRTLRRDAQRIEREGLLPPGDLLRFCPSPMPDEEVSPC